MRTKEDEETQKMWRFLRGGTHTLNSGRSLHHARGNRYIIYFNDLCKPIKNKHPFTTLKTQQICHYSRTRKTSGLDLLCKAGVDFSFSNNFANPGSFVKVSVPVQSIIPWIYSWQWKLLCILQRYERKVTIHRLSGSKAPKTEQVECLKHRINNIREKASGF